MKNQILQGDALTKLKELKEKSVDMCMTSPPYWALRDYGSDVETIWDSDKPNCWNNSGHDFNIKERYIHRGSANNTVHGAINAGGLEADWKSKDGFCSKCGAWKGQLGLEPTFDLYIKHLCDIFDEIKRVLKDEGTIWVNLGDTWGGSGNSSGHKEDSKNAGKLTKVYGASKGNQKTTKNFQKSLVGIPFRFAIEMINRGWILRNTIIWHKPNCMPSSVKDRFTLDFEYIFFFSKKKKYYFEQQLEQHQSKNIFISNKKIRRGLKKGDVNIGAEQRHSGNINYGKAGRNKRCVWKISPKPFPEAHFAVYPEELCETPIKAGCPDGGIVLDPFFGAGTTGLVALKQGKNFIGIELNPRYIEIAKKRLKPYLEQKKLR